MASKKELKARIAELEDRQRFLDARIERDRARVEEVKALKARIAELEAALAAERAKAPAKPLAPWPPSAPWITDPPPQPYRLREAPNTGNPEWYNPWLITC